MGFRVNLYKVLSALVLALISVGAQRVEAMPPFMETARSTYNFKPDGTIDRKSCSLCHTGATNANSLNYYGKDLQAALKASDSQKVTPELLHSLDAKDSDGDGFSNGSELRADTLPGDPASKPDGPRPGSLKPSVAVKDGSESNPFSFQSLFYPSHAQHPVIVHFPIALFVFSLFLDMMGIRSKNPAFNAAGYFNLVASAVTGILSVITGLVAWRIKLGGASLMDDKWLMYHLILAVITTVLLCILWWIRARQPQNSARPLSNLYIVLAVLTFLAITLTGHIGGIVSGVVA